MADPYIRILSDEVLADPIARAEKEALYGRAEVAAEIGRRQRARMQIVDLRDDDLAPPMDEWERRQLQEGNRWDPVAAAGVRATRTTLGSVFDVELQRRAQAKALEQQKSQWAIAVGATLILSGGKILREGEGIALSDFDVGEHGHEVMSELVRRGCVIEIDAHEAWLRSLPAHIGPYVVLRELDLDGQRFERGAGISEHDFPAPVRVREFQRHDRVADMTVAELDARILATLVRYSLLPAMNAMPPMSAFNAAVGAGQIERAPNYDPSAPAPPATESPPQPPKRGVLSRLTGTARKASR